MVICAALSTTLQFCALLQQPPTDKKHIKMQVCKTETQGCVLVPVSFRLYCQCRGSQMKIKSLFLFKKTNLQYLRYCLHDLVILIHKSKIHICCTATDAEEQWKTKKVWSFILKAERYYNGNRLYSKIRYSRRWNMSTLSRVSLNRDLFAPGCTLARHTNFFFKLGQINFGEIIMPS